MRSQLGVWYGPCESARQVLEYQRCLEKIRIFFYTASFPNNKTHICTPNPQLPDDSRPNMVEAGYIRICYGNGKHTVDKKMAHLEENLGSSWYLGLGPKLDQAYLMLWQHKRSYSGRFQWGHSAEVCGSDESGKCGRVPWHRWNHFTIMAIWQVSYWRALDKDY